LDIKNTDIQDDKTKQTTTTLEKEIEDFKDPNNNIVEKEIIENPPSTNNESSSSPEGNNEQLDLTGLARFLKEGGLPITIEEDEKLDSTEKFLSKIDNVIQDKIENYKNSIPKVIKELINNYEENVPLDQLIELKSREIELNNLTEQQVIDDKELQKQVIEQEMIIKGIDEETINEMLENFDNLGKIEEKSLKSLSNLKVLYAKEEERLKVEAKKAQLYYKRKNDEQLKEIKKNIENIEDIYKIPGIDYNNTLKDKIYTSMTTIVNKTKDGKSLNDIMYKANLDRLGFEKVLHSLNAIGVFELKKDESGNNKIVPNWNKLKASTKTESLKDLANSINSITRAKSISNNLNLKDDASILDEITNITNMQIVNK
jgi:hypothetical protein